jgi:hypothetical protein
VQHPTKLVVALVGSLGAELFSERFKVINLSVNKVFNVLSNRYLCKGAPAVNTGGQGPGLGRQALLALKSARGRDLEGNSGILTASEQAEAGNIAGTDEGYGAEGGGAEVTNSDGEVAEGTRLGCGAPVVEHEVAEDAGEAEDVGAEGGLGRNEVGAEAHGAMQALAVGEHTHLEYVVPVGQGVRVRGEAERRGWRFDCALVHHELAGSTEEELFALLLLPATVAALLVGASPSLPSSAPSPSALPTPRTACHASNPERKERTVPTRSWVVLSDGVLLLSIST